MDSRATGWCPTHRQRSGNYAFPLRGRGEPHFLLRPHAPLSMSENGMKHRVIVSRNALRLFLDLLGEIILKTDLLDRFQLRFDPIDMLIHVFGHILEHMPRGEVGHLGAMHHAIA